MATPLDILIVDDERNMVLVLKDTLSTLPHRLHCAYSKAEAEQLIESVQPDLIISDLRIGRDSGLDLLATSRAMIPNAPPMFILLTAYGDVETAVTALKGGAFDFLIKPVPPTKLLHIVTQATDRLEKEIELDYLRSLQAPGEPLGELLGSSPAMVKLRSEIVKIALSDSPVLILGESGTGKELVARAIHSLSKRKLKPLIAINVATLTGDFFASELFGHERGAFTGATGRRRGRFELAHQGSLFLDEIGELPAELQPKLLRVLEERTIERLGSETKVPVDVRVIAATNRDVRTELESGAFRQDLYYRLSTFTIELPPLWERGEDVLLLADFFLLKMSREFGRAGMEFTDSARDALRHYRFPGNIRELRNVIERAVVMTIGSSIQPEHLALPADLLDAQGSDGTQRVPLQSHLLDTERTILLDALRRNNWVQARAAKELGLNRSHLHYKIRKLGLEIPEKKEQ